MSFKFPDVVSHIKEKLSSSSSSASMCLNETRTGVGAVMPYFRFLPPCTCYQAVHVRKTTYNFSCDDIDNMQQEFEVNFLASAFGAHESFLALYAFTALSTSPNSFVEILVIDAVNFIHEHHVGLAWLLDEFGPAFCVRQHIPALVKLKHERKVLPHSLRFLEVPLIAARYTYIGDVDVMLHERVTDPLCLTMMEEHKLPYCNIIRNNTVTINRLTGVTLLKTKEFYTEAYLEQQALAMKNKTLLMGNDEHLLFVMCKNAHGLPDEEFRYRPVHGLHLSLNRGKGKTMSLPMKASPWCRFVTMRNLANFLCHDIHGCQILSSFPARLE